MNQENFKDHFEPAVTIVTSATRNCFYHTKRSRPPVGIQILDGRFVEQLQ